MTKTSQQYMGPPEKKIHRRAKVAFWNVFVRSLTSESKNTFWKADRSYQTQHILLPPKQTGVQYGFLDLYTSEILTSKKKERYKAFSTSGENLSF